MAVYNLLSKCDRAVVAYLISDGAGTSADVFPAKQSSNLPNPPFTVVMSESGSEEVQFSGLYNVATTIEVHTNACPDNDQDTEQMRLDSDDRVAATFDAMHDKLFQCGDQLADLITAAAASASITDFSVDNVTDFKFSQGRGEKDGEWIDTLEFRLICRMSGGD
jgi:hypothetical protein